MDLFIYVRTVLGTNYVLEKDKIWLTMSSYKKMISHDLNFFAKNLFLLCMRFPGLRPTEGKRRRKK